MIDHPANGFGLVAVSPAMQRRPVEFCTDPGGDSPALLAAHIGRVTADFAAVLFLLPILSRVRSIFEAELQDEVAGLLPTTPASTRPNAATASASPGWRSIAGCRCMAKPRALGVAHEAP